MFNLFRSKNSSNNFAKTAKIETVYEQGKIASLMVIIPESSKSILKVLKNDEPKVSFINEIEERIFNNDYIDTRPPMLNDLAPYKDKNKDISKASRAVVTDKFEPIFGWDV